MWSNQRGLGRQIAPNRQRQRRLFTLPSISYDIEIAIGTDARAVGPVDINGQRRRIQNSAALSCSKARVRWLSASLAWAVISPKV